MNEDRSWEERVSRAGGIKNLWDAMKSDGESVERQIGEIFSSPLFDLMGIRVEKADEGHSQLTLSLTRETTRIGGSLHGGIIMYALDTAMGIAVMTQNRGFGQATLELKVNFLAPLTKDPFRATGHVIRIGRSTAVAEGRITDVNEKPCAVGLGTWHIVSERLPDL